MPASLLEAFSSPSIGGTESLHNPRYELDLDRGLKIQNQGLNPGSGFLPSPGILTSGTGGISGSHNILGGGPPKKTQNGGCRGQGDRDSTISLDNETKCDLHLYHILSCQTCREKLKALLVPIGPIGRTDTNLDTYNGVGVRVGERGATQLQVNQLLEGLLGLNINEKIKAAVQNGRPKAAAAPVAPVAPAAPTDNLFFYILIGFFLLYLLDLVLRRRWI